MTDLVALEARVDKDGDGACWIWRDGLSSKGHPRGSLWGRSGSIRRAVWERVHGGKLPKGQWVTVKCGVKLCLNPNHLGLRVVLDDRERFWQLVTKAPGDACWLWEHATDVRGYPVFRKRHGTIRGNRMAWEATHGSVPKDMLVCHRCDNPLCVRPDHLFLGTDLDNIRDMWSKGRSGPQRAKARGEPWGAKRVAWLKEQKEAKP